jgi:hypothetical protein
VMEAVARATRHAVGSSVSLGAPRQRPVRFEPRCRPGGDPAPCAPARVHVLLRDLHLAHHGRAGRPSGHRRAWARRVGARHPDLRYYRCCPRSASTSSGLSNEPNNSTFCPETGSGQPFFVASVYVALHSPRLEHCVRLAVPRRCAATKSREIRHKRGGAMQVG